jgi:hypothetical protein
MAELRHPSATAAQRINNRPHSVLGHAVLARKPGSYFSFFLGARHKNASSQFIFDKNVEQRPQFQSAGKPFSKGREATLKGSSRMFL